MNVIVCWSSFIACVGLLVSFQVSVVGMLWWLYQWVSVIWRCVSRRCADACCCVCCRVISLCGHALLRLVGCFPLSIPRCLLKDCVPRCHCFVVVQPVAVTVLLLLVGVVRFVAGFVLSRFQYEGVIVVDVHCYCFLSCCIVLVPLGLHVSTVMIVADACVSHF